ncbi:LURP-one-related/scramblase family protein [Kitasatospora sp. NPDC001540]|uniref:LURP-one-related/scramblase family protein n=1 Tax=Kitasatospora sp. NPDC001540 TaxID=3364014 RepID=UPI00368B748F
MGRKFVVKERLFAVGDDYWVEDEHGEKAFLVDGKVLRVRDTFELRDTAGNTVATIREKVLTVRDAMKIENADGDVVATVRKKLFTPFHDKYHVELEGGGEYEVHGDLIDKEYTVKGDGHRLAEISRKWFRIRDTYGVEVEDGVDVPLMIAIAVCLDRLVEHND